jgi:hypothetical protein
MVSVVADGDFGFTGGSDGLHDELSTDSSGRADISLLLAMCLWLVQVIVASDEGVFFREWELPTHPADPVEHVS